MTALSLVMPFKGQSDINFALSLATVIALRELKANPWIPKLYKAGVRYQRDVCRAPGVDGACERFLSPLQLLKERVGDCDDLAPWLAAQRILEGDRKARARAVSSPGVGYHVIVIRGSGKKEDPSRRLGMGQRKRKRKG